MWVINQPRTGVGTTLEIDVSLNIPRLVGQYGVNITNRISQSYSEIFKTKTHSRDTHGYQPVEMLTL
jgi:hypothetical protein